MSKQALLLVDWSPDWTANCVRCLVQPTVCATGHVILGTERIGAGWCRACFAEKEAHDKAFTRAGTVQELIEDDLVGWYGHWVPAMGRTSKWPGSQRSTPKEPA